MRAKKIFGVRQKKSRHIQSKPSGFCYSKILSLAISVVIAVSASGYFYSSDFATQFANAAFSEFTKKEPCNIKGNISHNKGRKIYHVPGQRDYESTVISRQRGERWFCSQADARAAGWKKAGR